MKETGPEAMPPPARRSWEERIFERFEPVPEPPLKSIASVLARSMIDSIVSSTELMKHALACWGVLATPEVEPDRAVEGHLLVYQHVGELVREGLLVGGRREVAGVAPHSRIRPTTRPISCCTLVSRVGVPMWPRKYLETTTLVASCDQDRGISQSICSKTVSPFSLLMRAVRSSHSTVANGSSPLRVK